ncbi:MAG TPA: PadR family transcriptional regulator [Spirochaetota bacterium]|jgi:DNA-binding PadR family transcriptional regulator|nr:PadR family transcriptional regulator [Spirochaetota bacterium]
MSDYIRKRLFQGFICLHILHHAVEESVYGSAMIEELSRHGYKLSPGTLYPILHSLEKEGFLESFQENVSGKIRKYYRATQKGLDELQNVKKYLKELVNEIVVEEKNE